MRLLAPPICLGQVAGQAGPALLRGAASAGGLLGGHRRCRAQAAAGVAGPAVLFRAGGVVQGAPPSY